ncbi:hypothetical protein T06_2388, partial [Trichinella sp. T6]
YPTPVTVADSDLQARTEGVLNNGDSQLLIEEHLKSLQNLPVITNQWDLKRLEKFVSDMEINIRGLKTLKTPPKNFCAMETPKSNVFANVDQVPHTMYIRRARKYPRLDGWMGKSAGAAAYC